MKKIILLVDDDSAFRESVRDTLEIEGYEIIEAENGKYALSHIKSKRIDLVITDILMPEVEGNELSTEIRKLKPGLKIIGMTGGGRIGTADIVKSMCIPDYFEAILNKPFLEEDLMAQVEAALT